MGNYDTAKVLISHFAGQQNVIGVPRAFCQFMGDLEGGVFLSQVIYWSDKGGGTPGWFYKSYEEWEEELMLSQYKVRKFSDQLKDMGILETKLKKANGAPTVHYRLDYEKFTKRFIEFLRMDSEEISDSLTETTTETTTAHIAPASADTTSPQDDLDDAFGPSTLPPADLPERVDFTDAEAREAVILAAGARSQGEDPWMDYNLGKRDYRLTDGVDAFDLRRADWVLHKVTRLECNGGNFKHWRAGLAELFKEAGGDFAVLEAGLRHAMEKWSGDYKRAASRPQSFTNAVRGVRAAREREGEAQREQRAAVFADDDGWV
jgi:hypothetical protein